MADNKGPENEPRLNLEHGQVTIEPRNGRCHQRSPERRWL